MLSRNVTLHFPIPLPGGDLAHVTARPIIGGEFYLMRSGEDGAWQAFAHSLRLPIDVLMRLDPFDHRRITDAIADLSFEAVEHANRQLRPALTAIAGGKQ